MSRRKLRESLADRELSAVLRNDVEVTRGGGRTIALYWGDMLN